MKEKTRIALVGCGRWGSNCLRDLNSLNCDVVVVAVSEESEQRARAGGAAGLVRTVADLPAIDGIVVATPTSTHADVVESLLDRKVPIFVEKPITADANRARSLAAAAPDRIFVMDKWRYHAGIEALRDLASSQELGPVLGLRLTRMQWKTPHTDVDDVWILAPHDLSICLEILGYIPEPKSAAGEVIDRRATTLFAVLGESPWCVLETSGRHPQYLREIRLHCRDGIAVLNDGYADSIQIFRASADRSAQEPQPELRHISGEFPLLRELRAFVEHIHGGAPPRSSAAEGAQIVSVLAKLRQLAGLEEPSLIK